MAITRKTWYGIARETTPGTAIATPNKYMPYKGDFKFDRKPEYDTSERGTRDTNWSVNYTSRKGTADFKGFFYSDTSPYFLLGAMGADTVTQPDATDFPTVYLHTLSLTDVVPSFTLFKNLDTQIWQMPMSYVEKFTIKGVVEGKLLELDASMAGLFPLKLAGPFTPTFSTVKPLASYSTTVTLGVAGSTAQTFDVSEFSVEYTQKVIPWYSANGSPDVTSYYVTERTAKFDLTLRYENAGGVAEFDKFLGFTNSNIPLDSGLAIQTNGLLYGTHSATNYYEQLNIGLPIVNYDSVEPDLSKDVVMLKLKGTARPSSSTALMTASVQNTVASYAL